MKRVKMIFLMCTLVLSLCQLAMSQSNPTLVRDRIVKTGGTSTQYEFSVESIAIPTFAYNEDYSNITSFSPIDLSGSPYTFKAFITANFIGTATFAMEWYASSNNFPFIEPRVTFYEIEVVESILDAKVDVVTIDNSITSVEIYPLVNDFGEFAPLTLSDVSQVMYGSAEVTDSNTIIYTVSDTNMDYLMYTITDSIGESASGKIVINILEDDPVSVDTLSYTITDLQSQLIVLPFGDLEEIQNPAQGALDSISEYSYLYIPDLGASGIDTVVFNNVAGNNRVVLIKVYDVSVEPSYAVNDSYFAAEATTVNISPLENDIKDTYPIIEISSELDYVSPGVYSYTPDVDFSGLKIFEYTIDYGFGTSTANIYVSIGNYEPQSTFAYSFVTPQDRPLVIKYEIPLEGYEFVANTFFTDHGFVETYGENDNVLIGCDDVNGEAFFIYYPGSNYVGFDDFEVEYCINEVCVNYEVQIEVVSVDSDECFCVNDCVWEGDTDGNGKVNVSDILPIGRHMGISGAPRESLYDFWSAEDTDNWTYDQPSGKNIKHADANGDGIVTVVDTNSISDYYNQLNNFVPDEVLDVKDYPFYLIPQSTEVDSGELLVLDIVLGSEDFPVKDLHGLAFSVQVGGGFADSASLYIDLYEDSWLTNLGPSIQMSKKPADGLIEAALTRTDGLPSSGYGIIGQLGFIVEDEAIGIKDDDGERYFGIRLRGAIGETAAGSSYYMPEAAVRIQYVNDGVKDEKFFPIDMLVSPNPTSDIFRIDLPNVNEEIRNLYLTDITGKSILVNKSNSIINLGLLPMGMYILSVESNMNTYNQKVQVVR
ncbi:T9SS type A sorting domain-containing protein [Saprospiraceae bacterium]|nr:T9SS type A sorting domain-containing protein [Saprospiraceae bacterium]